MKTWRRGAIIALSALLALLAVWGTMAAGQGTAFAPRAAVAAEDMAGADVARADMALAAPAAQPAADEPPLIGFPCGDGAQPPYWVICLYGDLVDAAGRPAGRPNLPITVRYGDATVTTFTRARPDGLGAYYAVDISPLAPDYLGEVTLDAGALGRYQVIVAPDLSTQTIEFPLPVGGGPAGGGAGRAAGQSPVVVWGYVVDFVAGKPITDVTVTISSFDGEVKNKASAKTTLDNNLPWPIYSFTQAELDAAKVVVNETATFTLTAEYNGDSALRVQSLPAGEASIQVNLFTNWMCDTLEGRTLPLPARNLSGVAPSLRPDGLPETTGADGLPDMACFWGYVAGTNGAEREVTVRVEVAGQIKEDKTVVFAREQDGRPRFGILVPDVASLHNQPLTLTAVLTGSAAVVTGRVNLDAGHSQRIDVELDVLRQAGGLRFNSGTNSIAPVGSFVYAGTANGLFRFSAAAATGEGQRVGGGPGANRVAEVTRDKAGDLWLVSRGVVYRYRPPAAGDAGTWWEYDAEATGAKVSAIAAGADGAVWFGTEAGELHVFRPGGAPEWEALPLHSQMSEVLDLSVSPGGVVWVAAGYTLGRYDPATQAWHTNVNSPHWVTNVAASGEGAWVTSDNELAFAQPQDPGGLVITPHTLCKSGGYYDFLTLDAGPAGDVWLLCNYIYSTPGRMKVLRYDASSGTWATVVERDDVNAYSVALDETTPTVWLGSEDGVNRHALSTGDLEREFTGTDLFDYMGSSYDALAAGAGAIFLAHSGNIEPSLGQYDLGALTFEAAPQGGFGGQGAVVTALAIDPVDRGPWIAYADRGVSHYLPGAAVPWVNYPVSDDEDTGLMSAEVYAIARHENKVWFATTAGISILDLTAQQWTPLTETQYYLDSGKPTTTTLENVPEDLIVDGKGTMWLSGDRGLNAITQAGDLIACLPGIVGSIAYDPVSESIWSLLRYVEFVPRASAGSPAATDAAYGKYWLRSFKVDPDKKTCVPFDWDEDNEPPTLYTQSPTQLTTDHNGDVWIGVDGCTPAPNGYSDNEATTLDMFPGVYVYDPTLNAWQFVETSLEGCSSDTLEANLERDHILLEGGYDVAVVNVPAKRPDLDLQLAAPATWSAGDLVYTLVISNSGARPAAEATLTLDLPAGFAVTAAACAPVACPAPAPTTPPAWSLGPLEPQAVVTMIVTATAAVAPPIGESLAAAATVATGTAEAHTANNSARSAPTLVKDIRPDLRISLGGPMTLPPGQTVTFTLRAENSGGLTTTGNIVLDLGPYLSAATTTWPGVVLPPPDFDNPNDDAHRWEQTVVVAVAANAPPDVRLSPTARIAAAVPEQDPGNNQSAVTIPTTLAGAQTLLVVAGAQLEAVYGPSTILADTYRLAGHDAVRGVVFDVSADPTVGAAYGQWNAVRGDPAAAAAANDLADATARAIRDAVQAQLSANPQLQYVVLVGGDAIIPFFRRADRNPTQWQESLYADALPEDTTVYTALAANNFLTDDCYTDRQPAPVPAPGWIGKDLCVPDLAIGRLVETPQEIRAVVNAFEAVGGVVTLGPAIVGSTAGSNNGAGLIDDAGLTLDLDDNQCQLLKAANLVTRCRQSNKKFRDSLLDTSFSAAFDAQHSTHYGIGLLRSSDVLTSEVSYVGMLLATIGCHAGLSVPPRPPGSDMVDYDMPQALLGRGGTLIATSSYGYGTQAGMGYSEAFSRLLTEELLRAEPGGQVAIGPAMVRAKQAYVARHWGRPGAASGFSHLDEKVVMPVTLYGLPMLRVRLPEAGDDGRAGLVPPAAAGYEVAASTIISPLSVVDASRFVTHTVDGGTYVSYDGEVIDRFGLPLQPARDVTLPVKIEGLAARGALVRSASFTTFPSFTPYRGRAWALSAAGQAGSQSPPADAWYLPVVARQSPTAPWDYLLPFRFATFTYDRPSAYLFTVLGAYNELTGEARRYDSLEMEILYGDEEDVTPPVIVQSDSFIAFGQLRLVARDDAADGQGRVVAVCEYAAAGRWESVELVWNGTRWLGSCPTAEGVTRTFLQVVDSAGNVTTGGWQSPPTTTLVAPDLLVENLVATTQGITLTLRNVGAAAVTPDPDFWVDVVLDPERPPAAAGDRWDCLSWYGAAWAIEQPIAPGDALTLTTRDGSPVPGYSRLPATLPPQTPVYAHVDAWGRPAYGKVEESHELGGGPYNNILGPVAVQGGGPADPLYMPPVPACETGATLARPEVAR